MISTIGIVLVLAGVGGLILISYRIGVSITKARVRIGVDLLIKERNSIASKNRELRTIISGPTIKRQTDYDEDVPEYKDLTKKGKKVDKKEKK